MHRSALSLFIILMALSPFSLTAQSTQCILVGPFHAPIAQPHPLFNFVFTVASDTAHLRTLLEAAAQNGYKLCLSFLKSRRMVQDSSGHFDLTRFKARLDAFKGFHFAPYDSLILCHLLFDEPQDPGNWGGRTITAALIDSAAAYSKKLFPTIPTGVGAPAQWLAQQGEFAFLDYAKPQYSIRQGTVASFIANQHQAAQRSGLRLLYSINVLSGWYHRSAFPADSLLAAAVQLLSDSLCDGLLLWKYDSAYFADPAVHTAIARLYDSLCAPITALPFIPPVRATVTIANQHLQYTNARGQFVRIELYTVNGTRLFRSPPIAPATTYRTSLTLPVGIYLAVVRAQRSAVPITTTLVRFP